MLKSKKNVADRARPSKLFLEVTTRCNLRCKRCVKQSCDNGIVSGDLSKATFDRLKAAFSDLDTIIVSGVGEPLLHPLLEAFIGEMKERLPPSGSVGLQSNGTLLNLKRIDNLLAAGLDTICISVDAVKADLLDSIRAGACFEQLEGVLGQLAQAKQRFSGSGPRVGVQFVLMRDNLLQLLHLLEWASRMKVDFVIVSHLLPFDVASSQQAAYPVGSDAAEKFFRKWQKKIEWSGLRMEDYLSASVKYYKCRTPDENKLIEMVGEMKSAGWKKDILLDIGRLMTPKADWIAKVDALFDEAMQNARSLGMDLILPARQPSHARHCAFIEDGSVFIAWDGSVYPCHFTWHQYACYPDGRKKIVQPVCFGQLESMSLNDIWNKSEFSAFRKSVQLYDYPYCCDCGLAPCDYIDGPEFVQDCYTNTIPCCDCPWPTGILNCLQ
jgi:putative metalloenzyme radical SAM/SPASM domain maturase